MTNKNPQTEMLEKLRQQAEELRRTQVELEASHARYLDLYECAPVPYVTVGPQGIIEEANPAAASLLGVARSALPGLLMERLVFEADRENFRRFSQQLASSDQRHSCEIQMIKGDATVFLAHLEATAAQARRENGGPSLRIVLSDITGRQEKDDALRESENALRESQSIAGLGSYVLNFSTGCWTSSDVLDELFGIDKSYARTMEGWLVLIHPDDRAMMADYVATDVSRLGRMFDKPYRIIRRSDRAERWVHGLGNLKHDAAGRLAEMRGTIQDITWRKLIEDVQVFLAQTSRWTPDEPFFNALARYLASSLKMDFVGIDRLVGDGQTARTVAVWGDGRFEDKITHSLLGTPGGEVVGRTVCCFPENIRQLFPRDQILQDLRAESYAGVTLFSHTGRPIGLISAIGRSPLANRALAEATLKLVAVRAAAELERLDAEEALQKSEERFHELFQNIPSVAIQGYNADGTTLYWNKASEELYGYTADEALGRNVADLIIAPEMRDRVAQAMRRMAETGIPAPPGEIFLVRKDGSPVCVFAYIAVVQPHGGACELFCVDIDLTARKQAEESNIRLATAVEQASETIVITNTEGTILYANPAFEKTTGYTRAEAIGRNSRILVSGRHDEGFYRNMWDTIRRGEVWTGHFFNKRKDGTLYEEEATISPVRDHKGTIVNFVAVKRDVTHEIQLEAQFRQSQKMEAFGQLAGGVAHDFNNILGAMMLQTEVTAMAAGINEEISEGLRQIHASATRAANLTRQLLLFSHKQILQSDDLDLNNVIADLVKMLQRIIGDDMSLQLDFHPHPLVIHADSGMLDQLIMNLVINARDAMPGGGHIHIRTDEKILDDGEAALIPDAQAGHHVRLTVSDSGCGIAADLLPRIFEPFFTTKEPGKGTGLGLATVFGIVKRHGASITVESEPGQGTTFRILFPTPVIPAPVKSPAAEKTGPLDGSETILLVEDEPALRMLTRTVLNNHGYTVLEAADGVEALEIRKNHRGSINLLLTDMIMPRGISGRALAEKLLEEDPQLHVIFTSGYSPEISSGKLPLVMGRNFIQKPATAAQLLETVRNCLESRI